MKVGADSFTGKRDCDTLVCFYNGFAVSRIDRVYGSRKMNRVGVDAVSVLRSRLVGSDAATRVGYELELVHVSKPILRIE